MKFLENGSRPQPPTSPRESTRAIAQTCASPLTHSRTTIPPHSTRALFSQACELDTRITRTGLYSTKKCAFIRKCECEVTVGCEGGLVRCERRRHFDVCEFLFVWTTEIRVVLEFRFYSVRNWHVFSALDELFDLFIRGFYIFFV